MPCASTAFFPTCLLPCTRRSHGRYSPRFRLFTCLVYVSTYCVPIAHLRQNKPFPLLYLGHAQIIIDDKGTIHCLFVLGKKRIAPLKVVSIPRLELLAAVVSVRLNTLYCEELGIMYVKFFWQTPLWSCDIFPMNRDDFKPLWPPELP